MEEGVCPNIIIELSLNQNIDQICYMGAYWHYTIYEQPPCKYWHHVSMSSYEKLYLTKLNNDITIIFHSEPTEQ